MTDNERTWLQSVLNTEKGELSDDDIRALLRDPSLSDDALLVSIAFVKTWLSKRALVPLLEIVFAETRPRNVRRAAIDAVLLIGGSEVKALLRDALETPLG